MSKYDDMREAYETRLKEKDRDIEYYRNRYFDGLYEKFVNVGKVDVYEKVLSKFLGDPTNNTDTVIVFKGKIYKITGFTLNHEEGKADTLSVECVGVNIPD